MTREVSLRQLNQLHEELAQTKGLDPETRGALERIADDIRVLIEQKGAKPAAVSAEATSIRDQVERLESEHPLAVRFIAQLAETLASLGI